jgi:5-oxoprolinase (ATP-hydrolysing)
MKSVLVHRFSGVLSAYGMGIADIRCVRQKALEAPLAADRAADILTRGARTREGDAR